MEVLTFNDAIAVICVWSHRLSPLAPQAVGALIDDATSKLLHREMRGVHGDDTRAFLSIERIHGGHSRLDPLVHLLQPLDVLEVRQPRLRLLSSIRAFQSPTIVWIGARAVTINGPIQHLT